MARARVRSACEAVEETARACGLRAGQEASLLSRVAEHALAVRGLEAAWRAAAAAETGAAEARARRAVADAAAAEEQVTQLTAAVAAARSATAEEAAAAAEGRARTAREIDAREAEVAAWKAAYEQETREQ